MPPTGWFGPTGGLGKYPAWAEYSRIGVVSDPHQGHKSQSDPAPLPLELTSYFTMLFHGFLILLYPIIIRVFHGFSKISTFLDAFETYFAITVSDKTMISTALSQQ